MRNYTVKFPLEVVSKSDTFETLNENNIEDVVKFNIKSTILTAPGERRGAPNFGVGARSFLFDFNTNNHEVLRQRIINQIREYVPYCKISAITVSSGENNPNSIFIRLQYTIPDIHKKDIFELTISQ